MLAQFCERLRDAIAAAVERGIVAGFERGVKAIGQGDTPALTVEKRPMKKRK